MLDFDQAQAQLAQAGAPPARTEEVALHEAEGRVLADALV